LELSKPVIPSVLIIMVSAAALLTNMPIILILVGLTGALGAYLSIYDLKVRAFDLVVVLIICSILLPPVRIPGAFPDVRIEEFIIYIFFPFLLFYLKPLNFSDIKNLILTMVLFGGLIFISIIHSAYFLGIHSGIKDFFEIAKLGKYILILIIIYNLELTYDQLNKLFYLILGAIVVSAIIGLFEYFSIYQFDKIVAPLYAETHLWSVNMRMLGTYSNPNSYGATLNIGCLLAALLIFYTQKVPVRLLNYILLGFLIWSVTLTGSRTATVTVICSLILLAYLNRKQFNHSWMNILLFFVFLGIVMFFSFSSLSHRIAHRYASGVDISQDQSWLMRLLIWKYNLIAFTNSPVLGWGPAKYVISGIVDNEYILILRRYGVLGFIPYFFIYLVPLYHAYRVKADNQTVKMWSQFVLLAIIVFMVTNLTNTVLNNLQTMDYWFLILGLFYNARKMYHRDRIEESF
jgi:O-antigen ligase